MSWHVFAFQWNDLSGQVCDVFTPKLFGLFHHFLSIILTSAFLSHHMFFVLFFLILIFRSTIVSKILDNVTQN